jgi:hypothetical protein
MSAEFLAEFQAFATPAGASCTVGQLLEADSKLGPKDREKLAWALGQNVKSVRHTMIQKWLAERGVKMGDDTIGRHRRRQCTCDVRAA